MERKKFVGFGELLLRLAPDGYLRFPQAERFNLNYTGAEGNMAVTLAYMGMPAELVTKPVSYTHLTLPTICSV